MQMNDLKTRLKQGLSSKLPTLQAILARKNKERVEPTEMSATNAPDTTPNAEEPAASRDLGSTFKAAREALG